MSLVADLDTPAVLVDLDVMERNISRMAAWAAGHGVRLRPHAKTHKALEVGGMQIAAGACGLSLAKTSEAEVFAGAGFRDIFVAFPVVGREKARRLLVLAEDTRLAVGVDSLAGAQALGEVFAAANRSLDVLLKVDVGFRRVGVLPEQALEMARRIAEVRGLYLRGFFTHAGQAYQQATPDAVAAVGTHEGRALVSLATEARSAGLPIDEVSPGSTPTAPHAMAVPGVTECRPGNYVFHDATQVSLGVCSLSDCALTVLATVVSVPARDRAVLDAGSKTVSSDPLRPRPDGHGLVLGRRSRLRQLTEEHGVIGIEEGDSFRTGEQVRIVPNHSCVVVNLHDRIWAVRGERVEGAFTVAARGKVQ
jgi:D-serine deaminase-like pyridoxal phosphate-dependent protein